MRGSSCMCRWRAATPPRADRWALVVAGRSRWVARPAAHGLSRRHRPSTRRFRLRSRAGARVAGCSRDTGRAFASASAASAALAEALQGFPAPPDGPRWRRWCDAGRDADATTFALAGDGRDGTGGSPRQRFNRDRADLPPPDESTRALWGRDNRTQDFAAKPEAESGDKGTPDAPTSEARRRPAPGRARRPRPTATPPPEVNE